MTSLQKSQESLSTSSENNVAPTASSALSQPVPLDEYELYESNSTLTTLAWAKSQNKPLQRGKRAYGRQTNIARATETSSKSSVHLEDHHRRAHSSSSNHSLPWYQECSNESDEAYRNENSDKNDTAAIDFPSETVTSSDRINAPNITEFRHIRRPSKKRGLSSCVLGAMLADYDEEIIPEATATVVMEDALRHENKRGEEMASLQKITMKHDIPSLLVTDHQDDDHTKSMVSLSKPSENCLTDMNVRPPVFRSFTTTSRDKSNSNNFSGTSSGAHSPLFGHSGMILHRDENIHPNLPQHHAHNLLNERIPITTTTSINSYISSSRPTSPIFATELSGGCTFSSLCKIAEVASTWSVSSPSAPILPGTGAHFATLHDQPSTDPKSAYATYGNESNLSSTLTAKVDNGKVSGDNDKIHLTDINSGSNPPFLPVVTVYSPPNSAQKMIQARIAAEVFTMDDNCHNRNKFNPLSLVGDLGDHRYSIMCMSDSDDDNEMRKKYKSNASGINCHGKNDISEGDWMRDSVSSSSSFDDDADHECIHVDTLVTQLVTKGEARDTDAEILVVPKPPSHLKRMSSTSSAFRESIFEPVDKVRVPIDSQRDTTQQKRKPMSIFDSMSSYDDLKYLIKQLRRLKDASSFGGSKSWTVPLQNSWSFSRKIAFITWLTHELGFSLRSGGGTIQFLQTSCSKGLCVLRDLENALLEHKRHQIKSCPQTNNETKALVFQPINAVSSCQPETPIFTADFTKLRSTVQRHFIPARPAPTPFNRNIDKHLTMQLASMDLDNDETIKSSASGNKSPRHISSSSTHESTPLVRTVTLDSRPRLEYASGPGKGNIVSNGRPSTEGMMNNREIVSQMCCMSPIAKTVESRQTNRLALPRRSDILPHRGGSGFFSPGLDSLKSAAPSFDDACVETPLPKSLLVWGSQPVPGKDWGLSTRCCDEAIKALITRLERASSHTSCAYPSVEDSVSIQTNYPFSSMVSSAANSTSLGLDLELDQNSHRKNRVYDNDSEGYLTDINDEEVDDEFDDQVATSKSLLRREGSVGTTAFGRMILNDIASSSLRKQKHKVDSIAKRNRVSICVSALDEAKDIIVTAIQQKTFAIIDAAESDTILVDLNESTVGPRSSLTFSAAGNSMSNPMTHLLSDSIMLSRIFSYFTETELLCKASVISSQWADVASMCNASLMLSSVGSSSSLLSAESTTMEFGQDWKYLNATGQSSFTRSLDRSWNYIIGRYPRGKFLSEGAFKRVYRVWNASLGAEEAVSVIDLNQIDEPRVVGAELAVYSMLSSLVRRNICPNFVLLRGVFTSRFEPPNLTWGSIDTKKTCSNPIEPGPSKSGPYQYIRMELCKHGDVEAFIRNQPCGVIDPNEARMLLFQMAFSLYVASDRYSLKHYDVKLLNFLLQSVNQKEVSEHDHPFTVLRYGVGSYDFDLRMRSSRALIAKLTDFGTANLRSECNGQPVTLGNFTTIENLPPEYMILGDAAKQGHVHDSFALGLCMLHLFTGHAPYEEIMEEVKCPKNFKRKLSRVWDINSSKGYDVIRSVILSDVYEDDNGNLEGEPDETVYDTLYRYLVVFGVPKQKFNVKDGSRVWQAIDTCLLAGEQRGGSRPTRKAIVDRVAVYDSLNDVLQYKTDCAKYSLLYGSDTRLSRARELLRQMDGGLDLLFSLVSFDPSKRASALDVINSQFMMPLRRESMVSNVSTGDIIHSFMAYSSKGLGSIN